MTVLAPPSDELVVGPNRGMQEEFLARSEFEVLYGGQAGSGSTWSMLYEPLLYGWTDFPWFVCIYFRRESPQLGDMITQAMDLYVPAGARYIGQDPIYRRQAFVWPSGARTLFSHMQTLSDMQNIHGHQYHRAYVDEVTRFPEVMYLYIFGRVRGKQKDFPYGIRCAANPEEDNEGYLWVYDRFISKLNNQPLRPRWFLRIKDRDTEVPAGTPHATSRVWVPKIRDENPHLNPTYVSQLHQLPEKYQVALLKGEWTLSSRPNQLVPTELFLDSLHGKVKYKPGPYAGGFDYAEQGKDTCVLFWGRGNRPMKVKEWPFLKTGAAAKIIAGEIAQYGRLQCKVGVDSVGPGVGVVHDIQENHNKIADRINPCRHKDPEFAERMKDKYGYQFDNFRSEMWWKVREDFLNGEIDLSLMNKVGEEAGEGWFENFFKFQQELLHMTFVVQNGVVKIPSKNLLRKATELGRSTDYADAFAIWNWTRDWDPLLDSDDDEGGKMDGYDKEEKEEAKDTGYA